MKLSDVTRWIRNWIMGMKTKPCFATVYYYIEKRGDCSSRFPVAPRCHLLASLYVDPEHLHQGIRSALCKKLLQRHDTDTLAPPKVCLLTLQPTTKFYEPHGFMVQSRIDDLPATLQFELKAGSLVSTFLGNDICCMVRDGN